MSTPTIDAVLDCLEENRLRATYGAVAEAIGCETKEVGSRLEDWNQRHGKPGPFRGPKTSWVVRSRDGNPADAHGARDATVAAAYGW